MQKLHFREKTLGFGAIQLPHLSLGLLLFFLLTLSFFSVQHTQAAAPSAINDIAEDIVVASGKNYIFDAGCMAGDQYYIDRPYHFTRFSQADYSGLPCIKTANDDKVYTTETFITFTLKFPATIYLYMDHRMEAPPNWTIGRFTKNDKFVEVDDPDMERFHVYSCKSIPGQIVLGGLSAPGMVGAKSMYVIAFRPETEGRQLCSVNAPATATPTPTFTQTPIITPTLTSTDTPTLTHTPTDTPTNTPTSTPSHTPSHTVTGTPTSTVTAAFTSTATRTATPTSTQIPFTSTSTPTTTPTSPSGTATHRLLLIYAALDNNLQTQWTTLVNNIEFGMRSGLQVRLYIDGPGSRDAYVYQSLYDTNNQCPSLNDMDCYDRYSVNNNNLWLANENSASPATLTHFISESLSLYPATNQVILTLVGHGSGWSANVEPGQTITYTIPGQPGTWHDQTGGLLWDDHPGSGINKTTSLSTKALGVALSSAQAISGRSIDLLYLDGCSMSMAEIAYELRNNVQIILASPNTDWASFRYDNLLPIATQSNLSAQELGRRWLISEAASIRERPGYPFTYALLNLAQIDRVREESSNLASTLQSLISTHKLAISEAFSATDHFESDYNYQINHDDAYSDLASFAIELRNKFPDEQMLQQTTRQLISAINEVVIEKDYENGDLWNGGENRWQWSNYHGLGIYIPLGWDEDRRTLLYSAENLAWAKDTSWDEFLNAFYSQTQSSLLAADQSTPRPHPLCNNTFDESCKELAMPLQVHDIYLPLIQR